MSVHAVINNFIRTQFIFKKIRKCLIKFFYLTSISILSHASEVAHPDIMEVLVRIETKRVATDQAHVSLYDTRLPIYSSDLSDHGVKEITLIFEGLMRKAGLIEVTPLLSPQQIIYKHQFMTINQEVKLPAPGDTLHPFGLGGFWKPGCDLGAIEQFYIRFYESDEEIRYILQPLTYWQAKGSKPPLLTSPDNTSTTIDPILQQPLSLVDAIREGRCTLKLNKGTNEEEQGSAIYSSFDIQRHGLTYAWISFIRNKST
ncbi:hypothetical protein [Candidatus Odyssella acanthamoebae]|uniref:Uncharacterized protein n=1 Tax=Candidatus Odyssella acanthamoebae TaxID=91604 RepID=A0A077B2C1_9PROT|nr:hypothetical protein [Candidatus Paracaedibacter acanthamoebae]AIK97135.1 hypothetical protein ID47_10955 [Candidatus Paracaedibacter acanthamoebae]